MDTPAVFHRDALELVFSKMSIRDLYTMACVCKVWKEIVVDLINRRKRPQIMALRHYCIVHNSMDVVGIWNYDSISSFLRIEPRLCIVFCHTLYGIREPYRCLRILHKRCSNCLPLKNQLPPDCPELYINAYFTFQSCNSTFKPLTTIFLPHIELLDIELFSISYQDARYFNGNFISDATMNRFLSVDDRNTCLLLFENRIYNQRLHFRSHNYAPYRELFFRQLLGRYRRSNAIWGFQTPMFSPHIRKKRPLFSGVKLKSNSTNFSCWSICLNVRKWNHSVTEARLQRFRDNVMREIQSFSIGFHLYTRKMQVQEGCRAEQLQLMFPTIPFIHVYAQNDYNFRTELKQVVFSINSTEDENTTIKHMDYCIALLILSWS